MEKNNKQYMYAVIEFQHDEILYVSTAPIKWIDIDTNTCLWPPKKGKERKEIINNGNPGEDWISLDNINILGKFATYKEALHNERKKINSESESSVEEEGIRQKRKISKSYKYRDDSLSPPPTIHEGNESPTSDIVLSSPDCSEKISERPREKHNNKKNNYVSLKSKNIEQNAGAIEINNLPLLQEQIQRIDDNQSPISLSNAEFILTDNLNLNSNDCNGPKLDKIIDLLLEIKVEQDVLSNRIKYIENMLLTRKNIIQNQNSNSDMLPLPLMDVASVQSWDEQLKQSQDLRDSLFNYLQYIGGSTNKICIARCYEKVFSNYVGQFCSWTGKRGNLRISDLQITDVIKKAVQVSYPTMVNDFYEKQVMHWFHHSKTRYERQNKLV